MRNQIAMCWVRRAFLHSFMNSFQIMGVWFMLTRVVFPYSTATSQTMRSAVSNGIDHHEAIQSLVGSYSSESNESQIILLHSDDEEGYAANPTTSNQLHQRSILSICIIILIVSFLIGLISGSMLTSRTFSSRYHAQYLSVIYSHCESKLTKVIRQFAENLDTAPAYEAIASTELIEKPILHIGPKNPYSGVPNPKTNANWRSLLSG
jgi:hypothetical protein